MPVRTHALHRRINRRYRRASRYTATRRLQVERLEDRTLLATIVWENRGNLSDDSDNFNATYGMTNAPIARAIVDQALLMWGQVLDVIETLDGPITSWSQTVTAADLGGNLRGQTSPNGEITMDDDGAGSGWYFDPQPGDSSEFTNILSPFTASGGPAGADFFRTIVHELGHALGINPSDMEGVASQLTGAQLTDAGTDQQDTDFSLRLLTPANEPPLITFTTSGALHVYEGPPDPLFPSVPVMPLDLMNAGRTVGNSTRQLISDLDSLIMHKAFGDTTLKPAYLPNYSFHAQLNLTSAVLTVNGDLDPANPNDQILLTESNGSLVVVGAAHSVAFPLNSINQVVVQPGAFVSDGNDKITIDLSSSNWIPQNGIQVNGGAGSNTLEIKGPSGVGNTFTVNSTQVLIPGCGAPSCAISYASITGLEVLAEPTSDGSTMLVNGTDGNLQTLTLGGSDVGTDVFTVINTSSGLQDLDINAMDGPDLIHLEGFGVNTSVSIDPGDGDDWVKFTPIGGDLSVLPPTQVRIYPSLGYDRLLLEDSAAGNDTSFVFDVDFGLYPSGEGIITHDGDPLVRHKVEQVIVNAGRNDDDFFIEGAPVDATLSISAKDGDDDFLVGAGPAPTVVQDIRNLVSLDGGDGFDTAVIDDAADATGDLLTVTEKTVGAGLNDTFFGLGGFLKYHDLSELTINTSSGSDTINIESTAAGTDTTINAGRGNDKITVAGPGEPGSDSGQRGEKIRRKATADGLKSLLTINGEIGVNTLTVIDNVDLTADTMTLTETTIGMGAADTFLGASSAGIVYTSIYDLTIWMGSGGNQVFVESTHPATDNVFIGTGQGHDTLTVRNPAGTVNDIRSRLEIDGQKGQDAATVDDTAETLVSSLTVTPSQVLGDGTYFGAGGELDYARWEELQVNAGQAGDTVTVTGTNPVNGYSAGTETKLNTGDGIDLVTVGMFDTVDAVRSLLVIDGGAALGAAVSLLDTADVTPDEFTITDSSVGASPGDQFFGPFGRLHYSNVQQLNVAAGLGHNVINVQSTAPGTGYLIGGGGGDDIFTIDSNGDAPGGTVDLVTSQIALVGGSGNNALVFDDTDDASGDTVSITPISANAGDVGQGPSDDFFGAGGSVSYSQMTVLALRTSSTDADFVNVAPAPAGGTLISVDGNDPVNAPQDTLNLALTGVASPVVTVTDMGVGQLSSSSHQSVYYREMEIIDESTGSAFELIVDMNGSLMDGNDGVADAINASSGQYSGVKTLDLRINGAAAFSGMESAISSLTVIGSSDDDTFAVVETADGLPRLQGTATLGHSNAAFAASGLAPQNVGIHYDGGPGAGVDRYDLLLTSPLNVSVFQDSIGVPNSGVVNVEGEFTMSYESLTPILIQSAGGSLRVDASLLETMTRLELYGRGQGQAQISGDGGFEATTFSGNDRLVVVPPPSIDLRAVYRVNSLAAAGDANPGDGICQIAADADLCTLQAAVEEANALAGPAHIQLDIAGDHRRILGLFRRLPVVTDTLTFDGWAARSGPASLVRALRGLVEAAASQQLVVADSMPAHHLQTAAIQTAEELAGVPSRTVPGQDSYFGTSAHTDLPGPTLARQRDMVGVVADLAITEWLDDTAMSSRIRLAGDSPNALQQDVRLKDFLPVGLKDVLFGLFDRLLGAV